ncbi:VWA domain-containing protein [Curtobacterium sp. PsM8]|uniref:VWA domain-containing protein n=1 Tax=Curtobacterium sp. PsM8 TaxID=3030532 RepID=UPI00263B9514|nr:VWA domain-containing protein [Curtobacterium sp. PsM8]MDN4646819.1 VWA domain-containing protein [Curtobacterium sp. PsM8]
MTDDQHRALLDRWLAGDRFGILCTGDAEIAERAFRELADAADARFAHAESVDAERLAAVRGERVLALAWDARDVAPPLLRRCTAVLRFAHPRTVTSPKPRRAPAWRLDELPGAVVRLLDAAGLRDHGLDVAASRLALGLADGGHPDPLAVVAEVVAGPRRSGSAVPEDPTGGADGEGGDDAAGPSVEDETDGIGSAPTTDDPAATADDEDGDGTAAGDPDTGAGDEDGTGSGRSDRADATGEPDARDSDSTDEGPGDEADGTDEGDASADDRATSSADVTRGAEASTASRPDPDVTSGDDPTGTDDATGATATAQECPLDGDPTGLAVTIGATGVTTDQSMRVRPATRSDRHLRGRDGPSSRSDDRGRIVRDVALDRGRGGIAVVPSLRRAAVRVALQTAMGSPDPVPLVRDDLRSAVRARRGGTHTVVLVDGSSSLGRAGLDRAGSAADRLAAEVCARRGTVSVVVAAGDRAEIVVTRATSLHRTRWGIGRARTGGGTPLAHGLLVAAELLDADEPGRRRLVVVSDGRPTVGLDGTALGEAAAVGELRAVLLDVTARVPDVALLPVGVPPGIRFERDTGPFRAAGVRVLGDGRG